MNLVLRKKEIDERLLEIRSLVEQENDLNKLNELEKETDGLQEERMMIKKKMSINKMSEVPLSLNNDKESKEVLERRGNDLRESRTIKVSSDEVLLTNHVDTNLTTYPFKVVSELVDRVHVLNLNGGETYTKSFVKSYGTADTKEEGEAYSESEPTYGYVNIPKVKITAYTEITEELEKLQRLTIKVKLLKILMYL